MLLAVAVCKRSRSVQRQRHQSWNDCSYQVKMPSEDARRGKMNQAGTPRSVWYFKASALHGCIVNEGLQSSGIGWTDWSYQHQHTLQSDDTGINRSNKWKKQNKTKHDLNESILPSIAQLSDSQHSKAIKSTLTCVWKAKFPLFSMKMTREIIWNMSNRMRAFPVFFQPCLTPNFFHVARNQSSSNVPEDKDPL